MTEVPSGSLTIPLEALMRNGVGIVLLVLFSAFFWTYYTDQQQYSTERLRIDTDRMKIEQIRADNEKLRIEQWSELRDSIVASNTLAIESGSRLATAIENALEADMKIQALLVDLLEQSRRRPEGQPDRSAVSERGEEGWASFLNRLGRRYQDGLVLREASGQFGTGEDDRNDASPRRTGPTDFPSLPASEAGRADENHGSGAAGKLTPEASSPELARGYISIDEDIRRSNLENRKNRGHLHAIGPGIGNSYLCFSDG